MRTLFLQTSFWEKFLVGYQRVKHRFNDLKGTVFEEYRRVVTVMSIKGNFFILVMDNVNKAITIYGDTSSPAQSYFKRSKKVFAKWILQEHGNKTG